MTKTMNYDDMLAYAKTLHPNATISHNGSYNTWSINIESDIDVDTVLPDRFNGTPAWDLYHSYDSSYDNELLRWGAKNSLRHLPLEALADLWNIKANASAVYRAEIEKLCLESFGGSFDFDTADNEGFSLYKKLNAQANTFANESCEGTRKAFDEKWNR